MLSIKAKNKHTTSFFIKTFGYANFGYHQKAEVHSKLGLSSKKGLFRRFDTAARSASGLRLFGFYYC